MDKLKKITRNTIMFLFSVIVLFLIPFILVAEVISWAFELNQEPFPYRNWLNTLTFGLIKDGE